MVFKSNTYRTQNTVVSWYRMSFDGYGTCSTGSYDDVKSVIIIRDLDPAILVSSDFYAAIPKLQQEPLRMCESPLFNFSPFVEGCGDPYLRYTSIDYDRVGL